MLKKDEILPALDVLAGAGFRVDSVRTASGQFPWEVTADSPLRNGLRTHLELHYLGFRGRPFIDEHSPDDEFTGFDAPPCPLLIEKSSVYMPDYPDNLTYLSKHFTRHLFSATADKPLPLKWMADIVSLVERHAQRLDWEQLHRRAPLFMNHLVVFYSLTPMPEHLQKIIPVQPGLPPRGLNQYPQGWPAQSFFRKQVSFWRYLWHTFTPPSDW